VFDPLNVPGYDVLAPLGGGRAWKAIAVTDRARVVLRPVHGGEQARRRLRRDAATWGSVASAHILAVRDVFSVEPDLHVVVSDYASGGGLDMLLSRRGDLDDGEIVTLVVPLAEALAAAHVRGLAHGRVSTGNVVFSDDGRPMLSDAALVGADADAAADDVAALVSLARSCLGNRRAGPVHDVLATSPTSAAELAAAIRAVAPARAIALHDVSAPIAHTPVQSPQARRRRPLAVTAAIAAIAVVIGVAWGHKDDAAATSIPQPAMPEATMPAVATATSQPWAAIVRRLERDRLKAYRTRLRQSGLRPVGLNIRVESVQLVTAHRGGATVRVIDGWTAYDVLGDHGHVVARRPAGLHRLTTLVLRRTAARWRVQRVAR
jgi:hypothetical protein